MKQDTVCLQLSTTEALANPTQATTDADSGTVIGILVSIGVLMVAAMVIAIVAAQKLDSNREAAEPRESKRKSPIMVKETKEILADEQDSDEEGEEKVDWQPKIKGVDSKSGWARM